MHSGFSVQIYCVLHAGISDSVCVEVVTYNHQIGILQLIDIVKKKQKKHIEHLSTL